MSRPFLTCALVAACIAPALAQDADPNTRVILDEIVKLNGRLDAIQKDVDNLRQGSQNRQAPSSSAASSGNASPISSGGAPLKQNSSADKQMMPGWVIDLYESRGAKGIEDGAHSVASFVYSKNNINKNIHTKFVQFSNMPAYRASAIFRAEQQGQYIFYARSTSYSTCWVIRLNIDDKEIFSRYSNGSNWSVSENFIIQGASELASGYYKITFDHVCTSGPNMGPQINDWLLQIRAPGDMLPRDFLPSEILHISKKSAAIPQMPDSASTNLQPSDERKPPLKAGDVRVVLNSVNVRSAASVMANLAGQLQPGQKVVVGNVTPDQEWVTVSSNGQILGFVKMTALHLNTN